MKRTVSHIVNQTEFSEPVLLPTSETYDLIKKHAEIIKKIELLKAKIFEKRPVLSNIMQVYGEKSLFEFAKHSLRTNFAFRNEARKKEFVQVFRNEVARLLGEEVAQSAEKQINRYYTVSTAEHNTPLIHTNYLNANLISSLPLLDPIDPNLQNIFILACANISFDNYAFPRGIHFTSIEDGVPTTQQLVFFPRSVRPCPVVHAPAYTKDALETAKGRLGEMVRKGTITQEKEKGLLTMLDEIYGQQDVLNSKYYTEQITKTNFLLWKRLFAGSPTKSPNMVFLEQENIVIQLLSTYHMTKKTTIGKLLFDKTYQQLYMKHFNGVSNAFDLEKKAGTIFFWAVPPGKKYREQLWFEKGYLVNATGDYRLKLSPRYVKAALKNRELIPATALSFILLSFYYGLRLRGAFEQTTYLTHMKKAYIALLREVGDIGSIEDCINTPTSTLIFIRPILASAQLPSGAAHPIGTLDLIFHGTEHFLYQITEMAKRITLNEAVTRVLPLIYKRIYPEQEQDEALATLSEEEIDAVLGLESKVKRVALL